MTGQEGRGMRLQMEKIADNLKMITKKTKMKEEGEKTQHKIPTHSPAPLSCSSAVQSTGTTGSEGLCEILPFIRLLLFD